MLCAARVCVCPVAQAKVITPACPHVLLALQLGREERWAHVLTQPERGCLLVARPREGLGMFRNTGGWCTLLVAATPV